MYEIIISVLIIFIVAIIYFKSLKKNDEDVIGSESWLLNETIRVDKELENLMYEDLEEVFGEEGIPNSLKNDLKIVLKEKMIKI